MWMLAACVELWANMAGNSEKAVGKPEMKREFHVVKRMATRPALASLKSGMARGKLALREFRKLERGLSDDHEFVIDQAGDF